MATVGERSCSSRGGQGPPVDQDSGGMETAERQGEKNEHQDALPDSILKDLKEKFAKIWQPSSVPLPLPSTVMFAKWIPKPQRVDTREEGKDNEAHSGQEREDNSGEISSKQLVDTSDLSLTFPPPPPTPPMSSNAHQWVDAREGEEASKVSNQDKTKQAIRATMPSFSLTEKLKESLC